MPTMDFFSTNGFGVLHSGLHGLEGRRHDRRSRFCHFALCGCLVKPLDWTGKASETSLAWGRSIPPLCSVSVMDPIRTDNPAKIASDNFGTPPRKRLGTNAPNWPCLSEEDGGQMEATLGAGRTPPCVPNMAGIYLGADTVRQNYF
jgi:hypothetical protein